MNYRKVFERSPSIIKDAAASALGWKKNLARFRGEYANWYRYFSENIRKSESELLADQAERLSKFVSVAISNVPSYAKLYADWGVSGTDIQTPDDLAKLPFLDKDFVRAGAKALINPRAADRISWKSTSGSTGTPMMIPLSRSTEQREWAFLWSRWFDGVNRGEPYSSFTGLDLVPADMQVPPFWVHNWANKQRMFSIFHMSERNLPHYVDALDSGFNGYVLGYGSAVFVVADYIRRNGITLRNPPRAFFNGSVELQPLHRLTIEDAFQCRAWDRYCQSEFVGSITEYSCGHLHYDIDYSCLEFIQQSVEEETGEITAELVATNVHNYTWPLVRYKTGDLVVYHPDDRCAQYPGTVVRRIHGRTGRYFQLPDGRKITNITVIARNCTNIKFMQAVQAKIGEVIVKVVRDTAFSGEDEKRILSEFRRKVGDELVINIDYVTDVERTKTGKFLTIVNKLDSDTSLQ